MRPGQTGDIIPIGDAPSVAAVLTDLATHRDPWRRRGHAARDDAMQRFTLDRMAAEVQAVYEDVLAGGAEPRRTFDGGDG